MKTTPAKDVACEPGFPANNKPIPKSTRRNPTI
jgi:hypothetical protein